MDPPQYTNLLDALAEVPDPRKASGKQHEWRIVLALLCAALASGQRSVRAIAQWVSEHATELTEQLHPSTKRLPSASTFYRTIRAIDVVALETQIAYYSQGVEAGAEAARVCQSQQECRVGVQGRLLGQSVDGKEVRGARAHGQRLCLVSLVRHESGVVLGQRAVTHKSKRGSTISATRARAEGHSHHYGCVVDLTRYCQADS